VSDPKGPEPSPQPDDHVEARPSIPGQRPPEAPTSGTGAPPPAVKPAKDPERRKRTVRTALIVVAGVAALLCLGGLGSAYFLYRKVSEPDRATPGVVLRQYLEAKLNDRDDSRANLFVCRGATNLSPVERLREDIESRESQFGAKIRTSPQGFDSQQSGADATVGVKLRLGVTVDQTFQEQIQNWRFVMKNQSGWRVCSAEQID
jgi:hypothetical protein